MTGMSDQHRTEGIGPEISIDVRAITGSSRVLGRVRGDAPGPTLIAVGGIHGNEPAGILGLQRILDDLRPRRGGLRGEFVALVGNREALARGRRFLSVDLNRMWTDRWLRGLRNGAPGSEGGGEEKEQYELYRALDRVAEEARGDVFVMDLHTTSARSGPWATVEDTLRNRAFALEFPVPIVLGLEERVDGTLMDYMSRVGHVSMGFEAGQHRDPRSVARIEAAGWIGLAAAGILPEGRRDRRVSAARRRMTRETQALPRVVEMRYRHPVHPGDEFRMIPGYSNLQPVRKGEILARDTAGEILAPEDGRILMPLYQAQGEDGFFVVREFRPFWLRVSRLLRRMGADRVVHWLPGVRRSPGERAVLTVDLRAARWYALEVLHLLGYRRQRVEGRQLVVVRRGHHRAREIRRGEG